MRDLQIMEALMEVVAVAMIGQKLPLETTKE
jgi:hypothetical protein